MLIRNKDLPLFFIHNDTSLSFLSVIVTNESSDPKDGHTFCNRHVMNITGALIGWNEP